MHLREDGVEIPRPPFAFVRVGFWALWAALLGGPALWALTLDSENAPVGYAAETDKSATNNIVLVVPGNSNQAVQLNYNFATTDSYSQLTKNFGLYDFGELAKNNSAVRFYARGIGTSNTLRFRLTDVDGDQVSTTFGNLTDNGGWQPILVPRTSLSAPSGGNSLFDFFRVAKIEFAIEAVNGGAGTLDIDKIELVRVLNSTGTSILLDNFDRGPGNGNEFGGSTGTFTQDTNASISTSFENDPLNVYSGTYSLKIFYNAGTKAAVENAGYFSSPRGTNLTSAQQVEFFAKASNDNEAFKFTLGTTNQYQAINVGGIGKTWQKIVVPFNSFDQLTSSGLYGGTGVSSVTQFILVFTPDISAGYGNLWLDDIRFTWPVESSSSVKTVDDMEEPTKPALTTWEVAPDAPSSASLESIPDGVDGRALRMNYDLRNGAYCVLLKKPYVNASLFDSFRVKYKATGASNGQNVTNIFEFHVLDASGVHYKYKVPDFTPTGGDWKTLTMPLSRFESVSGSKLDLKKLKDFRFTVLKNEGGKGLLALDDFEVVNAPLNIPVDPERLIQSLTTDNNPFSPNGDGVRDTVTFTFQIKESAQVRLRIYDSEGRQVKEYRPDGPSPAGVSAWTWDGADDDRQRVKNGLYFFQLRAEATGSGNKDKETSVLAVLR